MLNTLELEGSTDWAGQGNVKVEGVGQGGVYIVISGHDGHATLTKESATEMRDWLTEWLDAEHKDMR